jgi:hypothetical protein
MKKKSIWHHLNKVFRFIFIDFLPHLWTIYEIGKEIFG